MKNWGILDKPENKDDLAYSIDYNKVWAIENIKFGPFSSKKGQQ